MTGIKRDSKGNDLTDDLVGINLLSGEPKKIRTRDEVSIVFPQDIIFSLISGTASIVGKDHQGYLYTQNYVRVKPDKNIAPKYLIYLLNENRAIRKQFQLGLQGTTVLKYTLAQLKEIELPSLPSLHEQQIIGEVYFKQLRVADYKMKVLLNKLEGVLEDERSSV